jgi:hypothetical protein
MALVQVAQVEQVYLLVEQAALLYLLAVLVVVEAAS